MLGGARAAAAARASGLAGLFAALAATLAKLAVGAGVRDRAQPPLLRIVCAIFIFVSNSLMWTFYAKGLNLASSSAMVSIMTTTANFLATAFFGYLLYGETRAVMWWVGIGMTICGLLLLQTDVSCAEGGRAAKRKEN
ncbi:transmembrane protein 42 [Ornithorhynchus anatinus]|uniref:Transmembrane protein 42 n=1 Tax=Ornithorhynchus anatinus TaxID=9258 RepID=A0A6I8PF97_ORNAN|nr:transmembrane protein 42 [Ornithorhynchus anatinus]